MSVEKTKKLANKIITDLEEKKIPYRSEGVYGIKRSDVTITRYNAGEDELLYLFSGFSVRGTGVGVPEEKITLDAFLAQIDISVDSANLFPNLDLYKRFKDVKQPRNELRLKVDDNRLEVNLSFFDTHIEQNDLDIIERYFKEYTDDVTLTNIPDKKSYRKCDDN